MIRVFLAHSKDNIAVAFQKRIEVPGFHRSYWHFYKEFPGRLKIVVLDDDSSVATPLVKHQLAWLSKQYSDGILVKPDAWTGDATRYVEVMLMGRQLQGVVPIIALNGGLITVAQAACEILLPHRKEVLWTVYPAGRKFESRGRQVPPVNSTLIEFVQQYPSPNLRLPTRDLRTHSGDLSCQRKPGRENMSATAPLIEPIRPEWHQEETDVSKGSLKLEIPAFAYTAEAAQLFNKKYPDEYVGVADYCGPAHYISRVAALILYSVMFGEFFLGWCFYSRADVAVHWLVRVSVGSCVAMMEFRSLQWTILPRLARLQTFTLPLGIAVPFQIWFLFFGCLSCLSQLSCFANAYLAGFTLGSQRCGGLDAALLIVGFAAMFASPVLAILFHLPTPWKFEYPVGARVNYLGFDIGAFTEETQTVEFKFGRQVGHDGAPQRFETRFARWAQYIGLDDWESTHYEALLCWARACQMNLISSVTFSSQTAEFNHFHDLLCMSDVETVTAFGNNPPVIQCIRRARFACRQGIHFMILTGICRSSLQLLIQAHRMPQGGIQSHAFLTFVIAAISAAMSEFGLFLDVTTLVSKATSSDSVRKSVEASKKKAAMSDMDKSILSEWDALVGLRWRFFTVSTIMLFSWLIALSVAVTKL